MSEPDQARRITANWLQVQEAVEHAVASAGRESGSVRVVGVSKYVPLLQTKMLIDAGCRILGESRPQNLWSKAESDQIADDVQWHLIGHLQRNKIRRLLRRSIVIESVDSLRVLQAIGEESVHQNTVTTVLLEVNISGDREKTGFTIDEMPTVMERLPVDGVSVVGLMAMAGWGTDADEAQRQFEQTRILRDRLAQEFEYPLPELSMGMSGDFPAAIAEGATIVRIGSRLFEGIEVDRPT